LFSKTRQRWKLFYFRRTGASSDRRVQREESDFRGEPSRFRRRKETRWKLKNVICVTIVVVLTSSDFWFIFICVSSMCLTFLAVSLISSFLPLQMYLFLFLSVLVSDGPLCQSVYVSLNELIDCRHNYGVNLFRSLLFI
jgi:hypothetical protein